jgi:amidase
VNNDYWKRSAVELADGVRRRGFSSADVVTSVFERIRERNPELNAITVDLSDETLAEVARADAAVRCNDPLGALHGVPVTIKENVDQRGKGHA